MKHRALFWLPLLCVGQKTHGDDCASLEQLTKYKFGLFPKVNLILRKQTKTKKPQEKILRKKPRNTVFRAGALLIRHRCVLGMISSFPSACLKLTEFKLTKPHKWRELLWYFLANISLTDQRHHPVLWRKQSYGAPQLFSSSPSVQECNTLFCMCCALAFTRILHGGRF